MVKHTQTICRLTAAGGRIVWVCLSILRGFEGLKLISQRFNIYDEFFYENSYWLKAVYV